MDGDGGESPDGVPVWCREQNKHNMKKTLVIAGAALLGAANSTFAAATNIVQLDNMMDTAESYYNSGVGVGLGMIVIGFGVWAVRKGIFLRK